MSTEPRSQSVMSARRPAAHRSVSLLHSTLSRKPVSRGGDKSPDGSADSQKDSTDTDHSTPSLRPAAAARGSSGEEGSSNADKWFENANNDVQKSSKQAYTDHEPPYFLRNGSSSEVSPHVLQAAHRAHHANGGDSASLGVRAGQLHLGTDGSSTDGFRGVIDDLTIENKKLKRKLKKYEQLHDAHLKDEKLFEVRVHGLPPGKKRELEETLRHFAANLHGPSMEYVLNRHDGLRPTPTAHKAGSSQASQQHTDSAYASMSASGQGSSAHSDSRPKVFAPNAATTHQNIHTYLHDIPAGLVPEPNPVMMSDRAKKRWLVRRLEQLFSGTLATVDGHQQPLQQQEVSQMAARADRTALEGTGIRARQEGVREAQIMTAAPEDSAWATGREDSHAASDASTQPESRHAPASASSHKIEGAAGTLRAEQRPTRPLDLDPHRAQVPADNIRYMQHLGFSPPDSDRVSSPDDSHGWVYLNLLINMAQLHTINVTASFVRKAVSELSNKFEISPDGRKLRWKGGRGNNQSSSDTGSSNLVSDATPDGRSPRKRLRLSRGRSHGVSRPTTARLHQGAQSQYSEKNKLMYTPLFFRKESTDEDDISSSSADEHDISPPYMADGFGAESSRMTSSGLRPPSIKRAKRSEDGPIIFYDNARFCTDLSGERRPTGNPNPPLYSTVSNRPLGKPSAIDLGTTERRGPLATASQLPEPMDLSDNPIPDSMELAFSPNSASQSASSPERGTPKLEVSGIGGVWPADHFAINVMARRDRQAGDVDMGDAENTEPVARTNRALPPRLANLLRGEVDTPKLSSSYQTVLSSSRREDLPPSQVPPALSLMPTDDDLVSSDDEYDDDDDAAGATGDAGAYVDLMSPGAFPPSVAPQRLQLNSDDSDISDDGSEEDDDDDDDDDASDGSVDLLAAARQIDPEAIQAQEREYDANLAERLAEEIPAGSSAATAGGGSGFASPASGVTRQEHRRAVREVQSRLQRDRPSH